MAQSKILIGIQAREGNFDDPGVFYPPNIKTPTEKLQHYFSIFDVTTVSADDYPKGMPMYFLDAPKHSAFVVTVPKKFTSFASAWKCAKIWDKFWDGHGIDDAEESSVFGGGWKEMHEKSLLECLLLAFDSNFSYSNASVIKIMKITKNIPKEVKLAFSFLHPSWRENIQKISPIFAKKNWSFSTLFIENNFINSGWAGSRKTTVPLDANILLTSDFVYIDLNGPLGRGLGSYAGEKSNFLENLLQNLNGVGRKISPKIKIICCFSNNMPGTTYCFPLPKMFISGIFLHPKMNDLPIGVTDKPCCLHDALTMKTLLGRTHEKRVVKAKLQKKKFRKLKVV